MDIYHDLQVPREGQPENATVSVLAAYAVGLREALEIGIKSAYPHPTEHPTMTAAWKVMKAALALPLPDAAREVEVMREYCAVALEYWHPDSEEKKKWFNRPLCDRYDAALAALRAAKEKAK